MKLINIISILILLLVLLYSAANAQNIINPSSVNVNELSDSQVDRIIQDMQARGLTEDQAVALAKSQGASQAQIDQMLERIHQRQISSQGSVVIPGVSTPGRVVGSSRLLLSIKAPVRATEKNKKIFGFNIFNSENLTFEPSANIPTPKNYTLGIGDQVVITVWGASQSHLQLMIDQNGSVTIPDIGPVYLSGMTFEKAQALIKSRLTAIYSGMS